MKGSERKCKEMKGHERNLEGKCKNMKANRKQNERQCKEMNATLTEVEGTERRTNGHGRQRKDMRRSMQHMQGNERNSMVNVKKPIGNRYVIIQITTTHRKSKGNQ